MIEWHVILNRTGARVFKTANKNDSIKLVKEFRNPLGQERNREMQSDRPGSQKFRIRGSAISHAMTKNTEPHEEAASQFVKKVGKWLTKESENFDKLTIFADPHLAGLIKPLFENRKIEIEWHHKNLAKFSTREINKMVHEYK